VAGSREGELVVVSRILFRGVGAPCRAPDPEAQPFSRVIGPYDNMGILSLRHGPTSRIPDSLQAQVTRSETPLDLGVYLQISFWVEVRGVPALLEGMRRLREAVMKAAVVVSRNTTFKGEWFSFPPNNSHSVKGLG